MSEYSGNRRMLMTISKNVIDVLSIPGYLHSTTVYASVKDTQRMVHPTKINNLEVI